MKWSSGRRGRLKDLRYGTAYGIVDKRNILLQQEVKSSVGPLMSEINKIQQEKATMEQVVH